jgi:hypothetical protein
LGSGNQITVTTTPTRVIKGGWVASYFAWLDSSRDEQRRMRELLNLFTETESRDELGIGQVRDAFSDRLFPGTSTLHTRARYLLIVPWCFQEAEQRGLRGTPRVVRAERNERLVLGHLKQSGATDGLIGRVAGMAIKTLPSAIYWTALATYGIRYGDEPPDALSATLVGAEADELADRAVGMWYPTLPAIPAGFPNNVPGGLDLSHDEAAWLRDRMLDGASGTLLAHLIGARRRPRPSSQGPWSDPASARTTPKIAEDLMHAELFSLAVHGAVLLYNLLIGERYESERLTRIEEPVAKYRARLADWAGQVGDDRRLVEWQREEMWRCVIEVNSRIAGNLQVRRFLDRWLDAVADGRAADMATSRHPSRHPLAALVAERERSIKRTQSRLVNNALLRAWSGRSGNARLIYRWAQVRRIVCDVHDGLAGEVSDVAS